MYLNFIWLLFDTAGPPSADSGPLRHSSFLETYPLSVRVPFVTLQYIHPHYFLWHESNTQTNQLHVHVVVR